MNTPVPAGFTDRVLATLQRHRLVCAGDRVVVAVSGGPDSMALLEVLAELRERLGLHLCVAHLNHKLRGEQSDADAAFVAAHAAARGLPARVGVTDVAAERLRGGGSIEMAARRVRYAFLEQAAAELDASRVAVGHTADDQVETILQRLLRGGELGALRGMPIARPLGRESRAAVVRPLLETTRAEILDYLASRGVAWRSDESNLDPAFQRNWVRHELLPLLDARCGEFRQSLLRVAERARELDGLASAGAARLVAEGEGSARLDAALLAEQPRLVRRAALRHAYALASGRGELTWRALDAVECLLDGESGRAVSLADGIVAQRDYGEVVLRRIRPPRPDVRASLTIPGRLEVPEVGLWLECELVESQPRAAVPHNRRSWEEIVDLDKIGEQLEVRTRLPGDRFVPLGLGAPTKLKDFFIGARVPREERDRTLLAVGSSGIAWVVGLRLDDRVKITPATRRLARLRAGPLRSCMGRGTVLS